ncbi:6-phosphogluconate dehydrogenase (decarboxylating) [Candidatus Gottesmanbacteria bacterium RIFCSPHIGHO2_02_FULL_40_13]|uniref:6-phosphogluconate dehydrogenase (Decarboxylating) n=1 Tax=Candidatus Gottesmanbacteria bacterium RIFCSPHIGHO2_02_FULL_40_13 TaxID=1798384 RepID=A0A1F6A9T8_9BACT|nr:MAG: 6-phosphogluconate dehydrogenase (decarboxylating) [Candidatus Gottesmanbacteria bacterium RIFCSPHIGHO2_02_FULL_40_13]
MRIGFIGLGRMGRAMALHLLEEGVDVVVFNRRVEKVFELDKEARTLTSQSLGELTKTSNIRELINNLDSPRIVILMVPQGSPVDEMITGLLEAGITDGDIIIDAGNSFYKDSIARYENLKQKKINFLDVGTSGGIEGARKGACLMIGGDLQVFRKVEPFFKTIAGKIGSYEYFGPSGAGHFVKMVHNGVEYGMLQSLGEGFEILSKSTYDLDFEKIARSWSRGSVVRGWLVELLEKAFQDDPKLEGIEGIIGGGITGMWTHQTAKELGVSTPAIEVALNAREKSKIEPTFTGKIIAALRYQFGQHEVVNKTSVKGEALSVKK